MNKKTILSLVAAIPTILLIIWVINLPLPGPPIDQRAHPLAIKLIETFPELKNMSEDPGRAMLSWDVADIGAKTVATFRISRVRAKERQDMILNFLQSQIGTEPLSRVDLIFYWKDESLAMHRRNETVEKKGPS